MNTLIRKLSDTRSLVIAVLLAALMIATRGHHLPALRDVVPGASWAVFFLAGVYLRSPLAFAGFLGLAAGLDYAAISWGGVSAFCVSPAYAALLPAYSALWLAGRAYRLGWGVDAIAPLPLALCALGGTLVCDLISSGSFYLYSGRFTDLSWSEYLSRSARYLPRCLVAMAFWVALAALVHRWVAVSNPRPSFRFIRR